MSGVETPPGTTAHWSLLEKSRCCSIPKTSTRRAARGERNTALAHGHRNTITRKRRPLEYYIRPTKGMGQWGWVAGPGRWFYCRERSARVPARTPARFDAGSLRRFHAPLIRLDCITGIYDDEVVVGVDDGWQGARTGCASFSPPRNSHFITGTKFRP